MATLTGTQWILLYLTLLGLFIFLGSRQEGRLDPLSAQILFNAPAAVYSLGGVISYRWLDIDIGPSIGIPIETLEEFLWLAVLGMVSFNCAYLAIQRGRVVRLLPVLRTNSTHERALAHWAIGVALTGELLMVLSLEFLGLDRIAHTHYAGVRFSTSRLSILIHGGILLADVGVLIAAAYLFKEDRWWTWLGFLTGALLAWHIGFWLFMGKRGALLITLLGLLVARHLLKKRFTLGGVLAAFLAFAALFVVVELGRGSPTRLAGDVMEATHMRAETLGGWYSWEMWAGKLLSQGALFASLPIVTELFPSEHPYRLGTTYLEAGLRVLPRLLWEDLIPHGYGTALIGESWAFFYLAEAYMNFGWLGIILVPVVFGGIIGLLDQWQRAFPGNFTVAVIFAAQAGQIFYLSRLESGSMTKALVYPVVLILGLYAFTRPSSTTPPFVSSVKEPRLKGESHVCAVE